MATLRDQVYAVAAADTGAGGVISQLPDGLAALFGSATQPTPKNVPGGLHLYLQFDAEVPWAVDQPWLQHGVCRWRAYDREHAGYTRINKVLARLRTLYPGRRNALVYDDSETGARVYWWVCAGLSGETGDQERKLLQRWIEWEYRVLYRGAAVA